MSERMPSLLDEEWPNDADPRWNGPIHAWFGLSYASYLVLHRTMLQSMPMEWQKRFIGCLEEVFAAAAAAGVDLPHRYNVTLRDAHGRFVPETLPHYRLAPNVLMPAESQSA